METLNNAGHINYDNYDDKLRPQKMNTNNELIMNMMTYTASYHRIETMLELINQSINQAVDVHNSMSRVTKLPSDQPIRTNSTWKT